MLLPPRTLQPAFHRLDLDNGERVDFFGIVALHADEMAHKLLHGASDLQHRFDQRGVTEVVDLQRPSALR